MVSTHRIVVTDAPSKERALEAVRSLRVDKPHEIKIRRVGKPRSLSQNATYWMWCQEIADATGNDKDDVHFGLKAMFLPPRHIIFAGDIRQVPSSTSRLSVAEMAEYMTKVQAWAAHEGIVLTHPESMEGASDRSETVTRGSPGFRDSCPGPSARSDAGFDPPPASEDEVRPDPPPGQDDATPRASSASSTFLQDANDVIATAQCCADIEEWFRSHESGLDDLSHEDFLSLSARASKRMQELK